MKIAEAIDRFVDYIAVERRMAAGTVRNYEGDLRDLQAYLLPLEVTELDDLSARDIRGWQMEHLGAGEAAGTVRRRLSSVSSWLWWLRRSGFLEADLMAKVSPPRQPKHLPVFFKESETEHLYDEGLFGTDFTGRRDALMLRMLYETGMRRSELAALREGSVDLVPIEIELAHNISDYIALKRQTVGETEWLFVNAKGKPVSAAMVYNIVRKYMAGLSNADRVSPHVFRHSFATHILAEGGNIQAIKELLGHENLATTEVYTHVTREHLKEEYKHAHPRSRRK